MIARGTVLIEEHAARPQSFQVAEGSYPNAWVPMEHNLSPGEFEKELASAGWTFFYMAGRISTRAFGFDRTKMTDAALKRLITKVRLQKCNCIEIDDVSMHSFLGLPYVSISAHVRHIQQGKIFAGQ